MKKSLPQEIFKVTVELEDLSNSNKKDQTRRQDDPYKEKNIQVLEDSLARLPILFPSYKGYIQVHSVRTLMVRARVFI